MADLFDSKENLLVKVAKFEEVYPGLSDAIIEWTENGEGAFHSKAKSFGQYEHKASLKQYGELIKCSNPHCKQGGFQLRPQVQTMAKNNQKEKEGEQYCKGKATSSKPKAYRQKCSNTISYRITLRYKK